MRIVKVKNYEELSREAARIMLAHVTLKPDCVLGLATGSTPEGLYAEMAKAYDQGLADFSQVKTINLDEYKGLSADHDQSYAYFMNHHLFSKVNIDPKNTNLPNGLCKDDAAECARYEQLLDDLGGQDIQLLGIGGNGHIGFNEPAEEFQKSTYCVKLSDSTIDANSRFFASRDDVPKYAFSMGVGSILKAKSILLVANGKAKAEAIRATINGPITPKVTASILQLHPDVTIVADEEALSLASF